MTAMTTERRAEHLRELAHGIMSEVSRVIVGQTDVIRDTVAALIAGQNVLLEGVPGLGKTQLVRTLSQVLDLTFSRIQFTPDLMPADITGTNVLVEPADGRRGFRFEPGPIFAHLVLADEINRATPKTQSALLEAMQERQVSVGRQVHALERPFFVMATQNPIEMEGTYPLPEAQVDRFMFKLVVDYPSGDELGEIIARTTGAQTPDVSTVATGDDLIDLGEFARRVAIAPHVESYVVTLVKATHPSDARAHGMTRQFVRYGASPRAAQAIVLAGKVYALLDGRYNVSFDDIRRAVKPAMRHRILLNFEAEAQGGDQRRRAGPDSHDHAPGRRLRQRGPAGRTGLRSRGRTARPARTPHRRLQSAPRAPPHGRTTQPQSRDRPSTLPTTAPIRPATTSGRSTGMFMPAATSCSSRSANPKRRSSSTCSWMPARPWPPAGRRSSKSPSVWRQRSVGWRSPATTTSPQPLSAAIRRITFPLSRAVRRRAASTTFSNPRHPQGPPAWRRRRATMPPAAGRTAWPC